MNFRPPKVEVGSCDELLLRIFFWGVGVGVGVGRMGGDVRVGYVIVRDGKFSVSVFVPSCTLS